MTAPTCPETLSGLFAGITLRCSLDDGHHEKHQDVQLGLIVEWGPNAYTLLQAVAA